MPLKRNVLFDLWEDVPQGVDLKNKKRITSQKRKGRRLNPNMEIYFKKEYSKSAFQI